MEILSKLITAVILSAIGIIVSGVFFMKVWLWFIVPVFTSMPVLTLNQSIGVVVFISIFKIKRDNDEKDKDFGETVANWFVSMIFTLFMFGFAYVIYLFIR